MNYTSMLRSSGKNAVTVFLFLCFILFSIADGKAEAANSSWESQRLLIEGVYYLVNEGDPDMAERLFRDAIFSSSFTDLSSAKADNNNRQVVAEAFYFLGRIYYEKWGQSPIPLEKSESQATSNNENIEWAVRYLKKAEECGIVYDRLHPPLLDEISKKLSGIASWGQVSLSDNNGTKVIIEVDGGTYQIDAIEVNQRADITKHRFVTDRELDLEGGSIYKMKPDIQRSYRGMYSALAVLGVSLLIWLTRG